MRKTKIICTLGPSSENADILKTLVECGMDAARINLSHGSHEEHKARIERLRSIAPMIPIILDTKGPEIRLGTFSEGSVNIRKGQYFTLFRDKAIIGDEHGASVSYPYLSEEVEKGDTILIDDGLIRLTVVDITDGNIRCIAENQGRISDRKSINIPDVEIDQNYLSDADRKDIQFGIDMDVDFIAASFVRCEDDVLKLRKFLLLNGGENIKIISKIENKRAVENFDSILNVSDAIMIARGDMGVELPYKTLPSIQKKLIAKCIKAGKPVITATQMLDSMQSNPRPTRAEANDVANAIYDGTSAVMLSGETASGLYPSLAVKAMADIAEYTDGEIRRTRPTETEYSQPGSYIENAVSYASSALSFMLDAKAIIACTTTGRTASLISSHKPNIPIAAICTREKATRQLSLEYGIYPIYSSSVEDPEKIEEKAIKAALDADLIHKGDLVIIVLGTMSQNARISDAIRVKFA